MTLGSSQIAQLQGIPSQIRAEVTGMHSSPERPNKYLISLLVLRAENIPKIANRFHLKSQFFVTVTDQTTTKKTSSVSIKGQTQTVQWNKKFGVL